jgi:hypothetical protein
MLSCKNHIFPKKFRTSHKIIYKVSLHKCPLRKINCVPSKILQNMSPHTCLTLIRSTNLVSKQFVNTTALFIKCALGSSLTLTLRPREQKFPNTCLFFFWKVTKSAKRERGAVCGSSSSSLARLAAEQRSFRCAQNRVISFFCFVCVFVWGCVIFTPELPLSAQRIDTRQHKGVAPPSNMLNVKSAFYVLCSRSHHVQWSM